MLSIFILIKLFLYHNHEILKTVICVIFFIGHVNVDACFMTACNINVISWNNVQETTDPFISQAVMHFPSPLNRHGSRSPDRKFSKLCIVYSIENFTNWIAITALYMFCLYMCWIYPAISVPHFAWYWFMRYDIMAYVPKAICMSY